MNRHCQDYVSLCSHWLCDPDVSRTDADKFARAAADLDNVHKTELLFNISVVSVNQSVFCFMFYELLFNISVASVSQSMLYFMS